MSNYARLNAVQEIATQAPVAAAYDFKSEKVDAIYGINVFSIDKMEQRLPKVVFKTLKAAINSPRIATSAITSPDLGVTRYSRKI